MMAEGRERAAWQRASLLAYLIAAPHMPRDAAPITPATFDPFHRAAATREEVMPYNPAVLEKLQAEAGRLEL